MVSKRTLARAKPFTPAIHTRTSKERWREHVASLLAGKTHEEVVEMFRAGQDIPGLGHIKLKDEQITLPGPLGPIFPAAPELDCPERKNFDFEPPEVSLPVPSSTTLPVVSASASETNTVSPSASTQSETGPLRRGKEPVISGGDDVCIRRFFAGRDDDPEGNYSLPSPPRQTWGYVTGPPKERLNMPHAEALPRRVFYSCFTSD